MTEPRDEARDVLAEALDDRKFRGAVSIDSRTDALIAALAARGYRLCPEPAPDVERWGPINDHWLMTAIVRIPRDLWPTGLRLAETVDAVVLEYEAIRSSGGTPVSPALHPADPSRTVRR